MKCKEPNNKLNKGKEDRWKNSKEWKCNLEPK